MASETFKGYYYTCNSAGLKVYSGEVKIDESKPDAIFIRNIERGDRKKVVCSKNPGVIIRQGLWLKTRDDSKAKKIFQDYANNKIVSSQSDIKTYESIIDSTKQPILAMF